MKNALIIPLLALVLACAGCATAAMSGAADGDGDYPDATSDARITREVRTLLYRDPLLGDERLHVSTAQGIVKLRGSVDNRMHIDRAMRIARGVEGVRGVDVEIRLKGTP